MSNPLSAQRLFDALKAEGVGPREYKNWRTHERDDETGKTFGPVHGVVIHHTAGRDSLALCYNGTASLPGPLCHTHLSKTGVANMISAGRANHAGTFAQNAWNAMLNESATHPKPSATEPVDANDGTYGIEIENLGDGKDPYPEVQYVRAVKWATAICRAHGWTQESVIGHKEGTTRKIDPSFSMPQFRKDVKAALALPAGEWKKEFNATGTPVEEPEDGDMAVTDADAKKIAKAVWETDGIVDVSYATKENPEWKAESVLNDLGERVRRIEAAVSAVAKAVAGLNLDGLGQAVAAEVREELESVRLSFQVDES